NTPDLTTRRLVLAYLADFASREPDVALLCVNTLQRDLSDPNPALRAMALRGMAAMRLHSIREIVMICVRQCLADRSPFVRRAAADALLSVASMD
ncbi:Clathrin/coatomer adaptor, adaptin-like protein, partial [Ramicandelaber brevisporus]